ncbi:unnamed protein product [Paramecium primaurelia]|uniref:Uncharacterized protein n=1 Tax=Paramecium primaurelia TaxID=5886 RepID=A0A8S1QD75_PARPR|nr:unnamed protein product [Paramecium primaurelia]
MGTQFLLRSQENISYESNHKQCKIHGNANLNKRFQTEQMTV